ncbi:hypothetical protein ILUMI_15650, partial [Ignelater luminosus]
YNRSLSPSKKTRAEITDSQPNLQQQLMKDLMKSVTTLFNSTNLGSPGSNVFPFPNIFNIIPPTILASKQIEELAKGLVGKQANLSVIDPLNILGSVNQMLAIPGIPTLPNLVKELAKLQDSKSGIAQHKQEAVANSQKLTEEGDVPEKIRKMLTLPLRILLNMGVGKAVVDFIITHISKGIHEIRPDLCRM